MAIQLEKHEISPPQGYERTPPSWGCITKNKISLQKLGRA